MSDSGRFSITLKAADANNIVLLLDFNRILSQYEIFKADNLVSHTIALEDLHAKIGLFSLLEADFPVLSALSSQTEQDAAWAKVMREGQKVYLELYTAEGGGPWKLEGEEILQNRNSLEQPWALMGLMGTNSTALLGESLKLGVKIASKAQGVGGLKGTDYVHVCGTWRKNTKIESKKKDNGVEELKTEIEMLKLAISGRLTEVPANTLLGRGELAGAIENIPQSSFLTPIQAQAKIDQAISDIIGGAPGVLNTLDELASAINDNANFGVAVTDLINTKASISNSLQLTQRSFSDGTAFNANTWITPSFAAIKWIDATYTNLNVPIQSGMIFQFDSLQTGKYRVQYYYAGTRFFCRTESNGTWNAWREFSTVAA